jgi:hypothetical protein
VDVPPIYDDLHLNLGAEGEEDIFEKDISQIKKDGKDSSINE